MKIIDNCELLYIIDEIIDNCELYYIIDENN